jgi:ACS family hexuronate transporter-like MFS transporter
MKAISERRKPLNGPDGRLTEETRVSRTDAVSVQAGTGSAGFARPGVWAWGLCWLMFACTVLNYMDRQAIALVGTQVKERFSLDNVGFGWVLASFQLAYAFFQWPSGYLVDRWDVRRTYAGAVIWWSLAGIATAFAPTLGILMAFRALLGVGESFNWPCALRVTAGVLPPADRSLGNGIFNSGAAIGAVLTPFVVAPLAVRMGWQFPFIILGFSGLAWVFVWLLLTRGSRLAAATPPRSQRGRSGLAPEAARGFLALAILAIATIIAGLCVGLPAAWKGAAVWWGVAVFMIGLLFAVLWMPREWLAGADWASSLAEVVRLRRFWVAAAVGITINVTWHFLVNWMAIFFQEERRLGLLVGGMASALPFLAADLGNLGGGALARSLSRRGLSTTTARKLVMVICMALVSCAVWVGLVQSQAAVIGLLCAAALGTAAYMVNFFAFSQDVDARHTGLVIGYLGGLGNLFAAGFLPLAGWISMGPWGFTPNFVIVGLLPLLGLGALLLFWGDENEKQGTETG